MIVSVNKQMEMDRHNKEKQDLMNKLNKQLITLKTEYMDDLNEVKDKLDKERKSTILSKTKGSMKSPSEK